MQRKIIYLVNPISGTRGKTALKEVISSATAAQKINFEILATSASGNYDFLKERIINDSITDVVVCGGDGSINSVCAALTGISVNIGIIPLGSGNGLALSAGIPVSVPGALSIIFNGKASYIDGFYINQSFSCMLCGVGLDAGVAHEFALQQKRGLRTYARITTRHFFRSVPYPFEVITPACRFHTDAFFISIANSNQFGNNFKIAPRASLSDGLLDIVIARKSSKSALLLSVLRQVSGLNPHQVLAEGAEPGGRGILYFQTPELTIINSSGAPLHIDGDPAISEKTLVIRLVKNAVRLLQPGL